MLGKLGGGWGSGGAGDLVFSEMEGYSKWGGLFLKWGVLNPSLNYRSICRAIFGAFFYLNLWYLLEPYWGRFKLPMVGRVPFTEGNTLLLCCIQFWHVVFSWIVRKRYSGYSRCRKKCSIQRERQYIYLTEYFFMEIKTCMPNFVQFCSFWEIN